jgi:hypothetical protein
MHGVTSGPVQFFSLHPARLQVAGSVFAVADATQLRRMRLGDRVTIQWEQAGDLRLALRITPDGAGPSVA